MADLRRIRNPLIVFASYGDNITPPHRRLGWIPAVYKDTDDLKTAGQRIVYLTNPHVGHLGHLRLGECRDVSSTGPFWKVWTKSRRWRPVFTK